jgi:hypothetical protein
LVGKFEGKKPLGGARREENIKKDLKGWGREDTNWTNNAHCSDKWIF